MSNARWEEVAVIGTIFVAAVGLAGAELPWVILVGLLCAAATLAVWRESRA